MKWDLMGWAPKYTDGIFTIFFNTENAHSSCYFGIIKMYMYILLNRDSAVGLGWRYWLATVSLAAKNVEL